jgi:hypothetical protein
MPLKLSFGHDFARDLVRGASVDFLRSVDNIRLPNRIKFLPLETLVENATFSIDNLKYYDP